MYNALQAALRDQPRPARPLLPHALVQGQEESEGLQTVPRRHGKLIPSHLFNSFNPTPTG